MKFGKKVGGATFQTDSTFGFTALNDAEFIPTPSAALGGLMGLGMLLSMRRGRQRRGAA